MRSDKKLRISAIALMGLVASVGLLRGLAPQGAKAGNAQPNYDQYRSRGAITVGATIRDFIPSYAAGGHVDFSRTTPGGPGPYALIPATELDSGSKPAFSTSGHKVQAPWRDGSARQIISTKPYISSRPGDSIGSVAATPGGAVDSASSFSQWFRDVDGLNRTGRTSLSLPYDSAVRAFIFDGTLDAATGDWDVSYSCEATIPFVYEAGRGLYFSVGTDADAWVYINGRLVIDASAGGNLATALAVADSLTMSNTAKVQGPDGSPAIVSTNSILPSRISFANASQVVGDVVVGPGGNPGSVISGPATAVTGYRGTLDVPVTMTAVPVPADLGDSVGDVNWSGGTRTIDSSFRAKNVSILNNATVSVEGHQSIFVEGLFDFGNDSVLNILPDSSLTVFVAGSLYLHHNIRMNTNTQDPYLLTFVTLGAATTLLDNGVELFGRFFCPTGQVTMGNAVRVTGSVLALNARMRNDATITSGASVADPIGYRPATTVQRIDLDRLGWLRADRTNQLQFFFANRLGRRSTLRLETNMDLLNVAVVPMLSQHSHD